MLWEYQAAGVAWVSLVVVTKPIPNPRSLASSLMVLSCLPSGRTDNILLAVFEPVAQATLEYSLSKLHISL